MNSVFYRNAVIVLFLTMMPAVAEFGGVHEAIFPESGAYYTLNGQRVENPTHGIYIKNGKKVIL
jgi:hypothetical protein